jgi:peptide/nickel transport system substrate-binding protein
LLSKAINTVDDRTRLKLLQDTAAIVVADAGIIPIHHQVSTWAMKKNISYIPRTDEYTLAYQFSQK